jgi:hypothetical protein
MQGMGMKRERVLATVCMLSSVVGFAADVPALSVWQVKLPAIQSLVRHVFPTQAANAHYPITVMQTADLSGTGGSEALINLGSGGYTDDVTVMQLQGDNPVAAKFRRDDKVGTMVFTSGTADDRGGEVRLVAKDHAIFSGYWEMKGPKLKECRGEVYQWDNTQKNFGYAKKLSKEMSRDYCTAVITRLKK